ncbi:MAG: 3'-5' exonuclease [Christensenellaceae bacterium]
MAVLYRTHTQARVLEEKLRMYGIPYRVFGGMSFYARKEIKDMVAYLTLLDNPLADTAFLRIVNTPKRGLGNVAVAKAHGICRGRGNLAYGSGGARGGIPARRRGKVCCLE